MTRKELDRLKALLKRIKDPDGEVAVVMAYVDRDIALREAQRDAQRENSYERQYELMNSPY